jgi:hypothetical protein
MKHLKYFSLNESIDSVLPQNGSYIKYNNVSQMRTFDNYFSSVDFEDITHFHKYMEIISIKLENPQKFDSDHIIMFFHKHDNGSMRVQLTRYEDDYFVVRFLSDDLKVFFVCDTEEGLSKFVDEFEPSWI